MKIELEQQDIEAIINGLFERLRPHLSGTESYNSSQDVFDKNDLAAYLKVSVSTINKLDMNKEIPHFKVAAGQSGSVRFYRRDIDKWISNHTIPDVNRISENHRRLLKAAAR